MMTTAQNQAIEIMAQNPTGIFRCTSREFRMSTARALAKAGLLEVLEGCDWFPEYVALTPEGVKAASRICGPAYIPHPYTVTLSRTLSL